MELYRPEKRLLGGPQLPLFNVSKAGHLKRALQALDETLRITPLEQHPSLTPADISPTPLNHDTYIDGSEAVCRLVQALPNPDRIPAVYLAAYTSALHTHTFTLTDNAPSFSTILNLLPELDALCGTTLTSFFHAANAHVRPFPFLRLPAELRLQVYDHLIPGQNQPLLPWNLSMLRISRQIHDEYAKHLYSNRVLLFTLARDTTTKPLSDCHFAHRYEILLRMRPSTRALFTRLEIEVGYLQYEKDLTRRYHDVHIPPHPTDDDALRAFFALLPNLQSITLSFPFKLIRNRATQRSLIMAQRHETLAWLRRCVPDHVRLLWDLDLYDMSTSQPESDFSATEKLGPVELGKSVRAIDSDTIGRLQQGGLLKKADEAGKR